MVPYRLIKRPDFSIFGNAALAQIPGPASAAQRSTHSRSQIWRHFAPQDNMHYSTRHEFTLINPIFNLPNFTMPKSLRHAARDAVVQQPGVLSRRELQRLVRDMVG
ncbi:MAG: hypothetical protein WBL74_14270 [Novosphingobium sp.]|uniref:hypothetical protein n=1 Tax=Novosphingobium sp. TaxID=1874826 RepID=UPI003C7ED054